MVEFVIGEVTPSTEERYEKLPIKVRALRQIYWRIKREDWTFKDIRVRKVLRHPIRDKTVPSGEAVISIFDSVEDFGRNTQTEENSVEIVFEMLAYVGEDEEPSDVINVLMTQVIGYLYGQHSLEEPGGESVGLTFRPVSFVPDYDMWMRGEPVLGTLRMQLKYRTRKNLPNELF